VPADMREHTDVISAPFAISTNNPDLVRQNEGSQGEPGRYDLDRWLRGYVMHLIAASQCPGCSLHTIGRTRGIVDFLEENSDGSP